MAGNLDITNGHAARMRFSRFKQQMEGIQPPPRKPRTPAGHPKTAKEKTKPKPNSKIKAEKKLTNAGPEAVKEEQGQPMSSVHDLANSEAPARIKDEPLEHGFQGNVGDMGWMSFEPRSYPERGPVVPKLEMADCNLPDAFQAVKEEPKVKVEPMWN